MENEEKQSLVGLTPESFFHRFVPGIYQNDASLFDWTTYLVDREFAVYKGQVPVGVGRNNYKELPAGDIHLMKRVC
jgi:hypothetical protein